MNADFSPDTLESINTYGIDFLKAMGLNLGIFHLEMVLTENGPVVIDPNPRLAGGFGPKMLSLVLGYNIYEILIDIHLRNLESLLARDFSAKCYATDRELACSQSGVLGNRLDLAFLDAYSTQGLVDFRLHISPGDAYKKVSSNHGVTPVQWTV